MQQLRPGMIGLQGAFGLAGHLALVGQTLTRFRSPNARRYAHAFLVVDPYTILSTAPGDGVYTAPIWHPEDRAYYEIDTAVLWDPLEHRPQVDRDLVVDAALSFLDTRYSVRDILSVPVPARLIPPLSPTTGGFCSGLIASAFYLVGLPLSARPPRAMTPSDLADLALSRSTV